MGGRSYSVGVVLTNNQAFGFAHVGRDQKVFIHEEEWYEVNNVGGEPKLERKIQRKPNFPHRGDLIVITSVARSPRGLRAEKWGIAPLEFSTLDVIMVKGTIKTFSVKRGVGFALTEDGQEVHFHIAQMREVNLAGNIPIFGDARKQIPQVGEDILMHIARGANGLKATSWGIDPQAVTEDKNLVSSSRS